MKAIIATTIALILLFMAGHFARTTVSEKVSQTCFSEEEAGRSDYTNSWQDVYLVTDWLPHREQGKSFIACVGPSRYVRYHPVDMAALSFVGAITAGFIAYRSEIMNTKKPKQKENK